MCPSNIINSRRYGIGIGRGYYVIIVGGGQIIYTVQYFQDHIFGTLRYTLIIEN